MKSDIAYYLLLLYITVAIHPLLPIAHDWWEHQFNETSHLAHVHDQFGNDHVEKEISKNTLENNSNKTQKSLQSEDEVPLHVSPVNYSQAFSINKFDSEYDLFMLTEMLSVFIPITIPPPKFS